MSLLSFAWTLLEILGRFMTWSFCPGVLIWKILLWGFPTPVTFKVFWDRWKTGVNVCVQLFSSDPASFIAEFFKLYCWSFHLQPFWWGDYLVTPIFPKILCNYCISFFPPKIFILGSVLSCIPPLGSCVCFLGYTLMHPSLTRPYLLSEPPLHTDIIHYENIPKFELVRQNILRWGMSSTGSISRGILRVKKSLFLQYLDTWMVSFPPLTILVWFFLLFFQLSVVILCFPADLGNEYSL